MLSFKEFVKRMRKNAGRMPQTENVGAELVAVSVGEEFPGEAGLKIFVWSEGDSGPTVLTEVVGNKTVHVVGQYYARYDPPRSASTPSQQTPKGDWHLYDKRSEIAAWDSEGKARHGFAAGTKIPKKVYDELMTRHPNAIGLKGRLLEEILERIGGKSLLL